LPNLFNRPSLLDKENLEAVEIDRSIGKIFFLALLGTVFSLLSGYSLLKLAENNASNGIYFLFITFAGLFMTVVLFQVLLIKSWQLQSGMIIAEFVALIFPFGYKILNESSSLVYFLLAVVLLYFIWGNFKGVFEYKNSIKIRFFAIAKLTFGKVATALALFIVIVYFFLFDISSFVISETTMDKILRPGTNFINIYIPGFHPQAKINDILHGLAKKQIDEAYGDTVINKDSLIEKVVIDSRIKLGDFLKLELTGRETINQLFSTAFNRVASLAQKSENRVIFGGAVVLLFFIIRSTATIINFFVTIFAYLVYEFLLIIDVTIKPSEIRNKEIIIFKHKKE